MHMYATYGRWAGRALIASLIITITGFSTPVKASSNQNIQIRQIGGPECAQPCLQIHQRDSINFCNKPEDEIIFAVTKCLTDCVVEETASKTLEIIRNICPNVGQPNDTIFTSGILKDTATGVSQTSTSARQTAASTNTAPGSTPTNGTSKTEKKDALSVPIIVGIAVGGVVLILGLVGLYFLIKCMRRRKKADREADGAMRGKNFGRHSSQSDLVQSTDRGIPLGNRTDKSGGDSWLTDEESNHSGPHMYASGPNIYEKPRSAPIRANLNKPTPEKPAHAKPPPITTNFTKPVPSLPRPCDANGVSPPDSPVSPVSPVSHMGALEERRIKTYSAVSSIKPDSPTRHDFYNFASPPLPTSAAGTTAYGHVSNNKPTFSFNAPTDQQEPVSPTSRNPGGKGFDTTNSVSTAGEGQSWEGYRDMIQKYEQQNPELPQPPKSAAVADSSRNSSRMSGLSQFNFGFNSNSPVEPEKSKRVSSFYGWGKKAGYLEEPMTRDKFLSGSSSIYSNQPPSPAPVAGRPGPSTPEIMSGRPPPSYTPPSPQPGRSYGQSSSAVSKPPPPLTENSESVSAKLARANSLRWRREVEAATDIALERIATTGSSSRHEGNKPVPILTRLKRGSTMSTESGKSIGFWQSLLTPTPKGSIKMETGSTRGSGSQKLAPPHARSEVSLVSEDGNTGVVFI